MSEERAEAAILSVLEHAVEPLDVDAIALAAHLPADAVSRSIAVLWLLGAVRRAEGREPRRFLRLDVDIGFALPAGYRFEMPRRTSIVRIRTAHHYRDGTRVYLYVSDPAEGEERTVSDRGGAMARMVGRAGRDPTARLRACAAEHSVEFDGAQIIAPLSRGVQAIECVAAASAAAVWGWLAQSTAG